jgi:glc operon protein GlcG
MPDITEDAAATLISLALAAAREHDVAVSAAVVDSAGALVVFHRMQDAPRFSADFAIAKARTSSAFGTPTSALEEMYADRPAFAHSFVAQGSYFLGRGGVPLIAEGAVVGAIGVSGADAVGEEVLAQAVADAFSAWLPE